MARRGPQLLPAVFSHEHDGGIRSLAALALLDTEALAPGHGNLWRGPIRQATAEATALTQRHSIQATNGLELELTGHVHDVHSAEDNLSQYSGTAYGNTARVN